MVTPGFKLPVFNYVVNVGHKLLQLLKSVVNLEAKDLKTNLVDIFSKFQQDAEEHPEQRSHEHNALWFLDQNNLVRFVSTKIF